MVNINSEFLINEVQKRPLLWDTSNEDYKDKNKKKSARFEIALSLLSNSNICILPFYIIFYVR
jgi:hypothetical protein